MKKKQSARKRFGQHFLKDQEIIRQIVNAADLSSKDRVLEIGPGRAALTRSLLASGAATVVEIDQDLAAWLSNEFAERQDLAVVCGDILKIDWDEFVVGSEKITKIVANLPYNISTPLFFKITKFRKHLESVTIMLQREVASRICFSSSGGEKKDYGVLSVIAGNAFKTEWVCDVPPSCFDPEPKVESAVIRLKPLSIPFPQEAAFFKFVQRVFTERRKLLGGYLRKNESAIYSALNLDARNLVDRVRAEDLSPPEFLDLYQGHLLKNNNE